MKLKHWLAGILTLFAASYGAVQLGAGTSQQAPSTGVVTALTGVVTSTLTAAQVCPSSLISITPITSTPTLTLPNTTTLFSSCLGVNGSFIETAVLSVTTGSIFAAGTGGTLYSSVSTLLTANKMVYLRIIRDSDVSYRAILINAAI